MAEKLCLQWNDFKDNVSTAFRSLRDDRDFADVTLACEDGKQLETHKVILAASSPFFKNLLKRNLLHPHPLIFMRNVSSENLDAIVDFLYFGEVNLLEQNLESFLAIADELQLKGLSKENLGKEQKQIDKEGPHSKPKISLDNIKEELDIKETKEEHNQDFEYQGIDPISNDSAESSGSVEEDIKSMMEKSLNMITNGKEKLIHCSKCKICGKEGRGNVIKKHIRATHLGTTCNLCGKKFLTRNEKQKHETMNKDCKKQLEHGERVNALMEKSQNSIPNGKHGDGREKRVFAHICKVCGKEGRTKSIRDHIEMSHLEDMLIPCNKCGKTFPSRSDMKLHNEKCQAEIILSALPPKTLFD